MKKKIFSIFVLSFLFLLSTIFPAQAKETKPEQSSFILEAKDNLINLHAEQASFKKILNDLERKAGIKVNVFDGVEDKKVILI
jgi:peptidoglycan hydrolase CwlO-like protein